MKSEIDISSHSSFNLKPKNLALTFQYFWTGLYTEELHQNSFSSHSISESITLLLLLQCSQRTQVRMDTIWVLCEQSVWTVCITKFASRALCAAVYFGLNRSTGTFCPLTKISFLCNLVTPSYNKSQLGRVKAKGQSTLLRTWLRSTRMCAWVSPNYTLFADASRGTSGIHMHYHYWIDFHACSVRICTVNMHESVRTENLCCTDCAHDKIYVTCTVCTPSLDHIRRSIVRPQHVLPRIRMKQVNHIYLNCWSCSIAGQRSTEPHTSRTPITG